MLDGKFIKHNRIKYGYKLRELAPLLGISVSYLSDIEHNRKGKRPNRVLVRRLQRLFNLPNTNLLLKDRSFNIEPATKPEVPIKDSFDININITIKFE